MRKLVRRWYWWLPALLVAAGLGYVGYRVTHPPWENTEAWDKYQRIRLDMTLEEGERVFGRHCQAVRANNGRDFVWYIGSDEVALGTDFSSGRVLDKHAVIQGRVFSDPPDEHWWDRLRARLGW